MATAFLDLIESFRRGRRPVFSLGPFLPIESLWRKGRQFNRILQEPEAMAQAALANLDLGFESIVLPFDLNVDAVRSYAGPSILSKSSEAADDTQ